MSCAIDCASWFRSSVLWRSLWTWLPTHLWNSTGFIPQVRQTSKCSHRCVPLKNDQLSSNMNRTWSKWSKFPPIFLSRFPAWMASGRNRSPRWSPSPPGWTVGKDIGLCWLHKTETIYHNYYIIYLRIFWWVKAPWFAHWKFGKKIRLWAEAPVATNAALPTALGPLQHATWHGIKLTNASFRVSSNFSRFIKLTVNQIKNQLD